MQGLPRSDKRCSTINSKRLIHGHHAATARFELENKALIADGHTTPTHHAHIHAHACPRPADVDAHTEHPFSPLNNRYSGIQELPRSDKRCSAANSEGDVLTGRRRGGGSRTRARRQGMHSRWPRPHPHTPTQHQHPHRVPAHTPAHTEHSVSPLSNQYNEIQRLLRGAKRCSNINSKRPIHDTEHPFSPPSNRSSGIQDMLRGDKRCSDINSYRLFHRPPRGTPPDSNSKTRRQ